MIRGVACADDAEPLLSNRPHKYDCQTVATVSDKHDKVTESSVKTKAGGKGTLWTMVSLTRVAINSYKFFGAC